PANVQHSAGSWTVYGSQGGEPVALGDEPGEA
ncbi:sulfurtransferase, partial [Micromonospora sp. DH15]|nr:sulfurtransferase [Micromonospora sp. DH15]